ncbi:MAG: FMN-binding protein [Bacteroidales bacterium]|nr:FMN-binding protein [Bacteroidales bacterium]MBN2751021.1 FMN-binding protein [Bacteroidales bacterium]
MANTLLLFIGLWLNVLMVKPETASQKSLFKMTEKHFGSNAELVQIPNNNGTPLQGELYQIKGGSTKGYGYIGKANGRGHQFTISALFSTNGKIIELKVTEYTSTYGTEVCNTAWLKRFRGKGAESLTLGVDVEAISGATISSTGLVAKLNEIGKKLKKL